MMRRTGPVRRQRDENNDILNQPYNTANNHRLNNNQNKWDILNNTIYQNNGYYLSATKVANYLLDDPILDWFNLYFKQLGLNSDDILLATQNKFINNQNMRSNFLNMYFEKGNYFESLVMDELKKKFGCNFLMINNEGGKGVNKQNFQKTLKAMNSGVPIIAQGVLFDENTKTCGMPDLLIRSDYINRITTNKCLKDEDAKIRAPKLKNNPDYHYIAVDIKWSTLHFSARGDTLLKDGRIPAYKGQLAIYNNILGNIQGYTSNYAFILGKGWKRIKTQQNKGVKTVNIFSGNNCFDRLGIIDYSTGDEEYIKKTAEAIKWYQDVCVNGHTWSPLNPPNENMYPNMSNDDLVWGSVKKYIAEEIGEITQVFHVGTKERRNLHRQGIYSLKDPNCTAENMGLYREGAATDKANKIDAILDINRDKQLFYQYFKLYI